MNFLFGLFFGALLTICAAYLHDSGADAPDRKIVNWSVFDSTVQSMRNQLSSGVDRLRREGNS